MSDPRRRAKAAPAAERKNSRQLVSVTFSACSFGLWLQVPLGGRACAPRPSRVPGVETLLVNSREFPGAVILGLLGALVAHAAIFGGDHAMGGAYHGVLLQLALAGSLGTGVAFAALAWGGAGQVTDGSVLAARLGERLPAVPSLLLATTFWFALGERIEPEHAAASLLITLLSLVVSAGLLWIVARQALRVLVRAAFMVSRRPFAQRTPGWTRRPQPPPIERRSPLLRRRFARPPPIATLARA